MRLRNVKDAKNILDNSKYFIGNPSNYRGSWQKVFKNENKINLEIGMGKGDFLIEMAKKYPGINFIGIEKYESVLVRCAEKLENESLNNILLICSDALYLGDYIYKEVDTIYLNFSDPWPKKKHAKRRLTSSLYLKIYDNLFKEDAKILLKTDSDILFESSIISLTSYGYKIDDICLDLWSSDRDNVRTLYENKFGDTNKIKFLSANKKL